MNYKDKLYEKYVSSHAGNLYREEISANNIRKQFSTWNRYFGDFLPESKQSKILDLGCGNGSFVYWIYEKGFSDVLGVDLSVEQVEISKKLKIENIIQGDAIEFLKGKKNYFDVIFMRDFIEHFKKEEILNILKLVYESLKKGGEVIIQTPNGQNIFSGRLRYGDFTHETSFTKESLGQIMAIAEFSGFKAFPTPPVVHGLKSFMRVVLWKVIEVFLKIYLLIETGSSSGIFTQNLIVIAKKQ